jgi:ABC-type sugar transport system permease subunit
MHAGLDAQHDLSHQVHHGRKQQLSGILNFGGAFKLTGGGPGGATLSLSLLGYGYFASGDFGYGAAASVVLFLLALGLSVAYMRLGGFGKELP